MPHEERSYRRWRKNELSSFEVRIQESDLSISADRVLVDSAETALRSIRGSLEKYIRRDPAFATALEPRDPSPDAPDIVCQMAAAARSCGVGPMAAVAGAVAQHVGQTLLSETRQVIVENGGDIFLRTSRPRVSAIFAGASPLSGQLGIRISRLHQDIGLCTSSGTVGPSLSLGHADAAIVLATSAILADAAATALGNRVRKPEDITPALETLQGTEGVLGAAAIIGEQLGAWGEIEFVPISGSDRG